MQIRVLSTQRNYGAFMLDMDTQRAAQQFRLKSPEWKQRMHIVCQSKMKGNRKIITISSKMIIRNKTKFGITWTLYKQQQKNKSVATIPCESSKTAPIPVSYTHLTLPTNREV